MRTCTKYRRNYGCTHVHSAYYEVPRTHQNVNECACVQIHIYIQSTWYLYICTRYIVNVYIMHRCLPTYKIEIIPTSTYYVHMYIVPMYICTYFVQELRGMYKGTTMERHGKSYLVRGTRYLVPPTCPPTYLALVRDTRYLLPCLLYIQSSSVPT